MAAVTPGAAIPAAVVPRTAAVAAPLFGAAKLFQGLLRGGPQHRGLGRVMSPTKGGHQGQRWSRLLLELWSMSDHACRTDRSSGDLKDESLTDVKKAEAVSMTSVRKSAANS